MRRPVLCRPNTGLGSDLPFLAVGLARRWLASWMPLKIVCLLMRWLFSLVALVFSGDRV
jgi:hypothetical protein